MRGQVKAGDAAAARTRHAAAEPPAPEFVDAIESLTRGIRDPVARLRTLRQSLDRYDEVDRAVTALPSAHARRLLYRTIPLELLRTWISTARRATASGWPARFGRVALVGAALAGVAALTTPLLRSPAPAPEAVAAVPGERAQAAPDNLGAAPAPALPATLPPDVWLVERGAEWELYSNGLRIETQFSVDGPPRRFRAFDLAGRLQEAVSERPVGLLFHTSESDIWPMQPDYNENLRDSGHRLLRYIRRERLYNYVVDRFGRVWRVVGEKQRPNHAGHSIWAAGGRVYLNLNNAFLGVCFESQWGGGKALPITAAQLQAGRQLSDYLRRRWDLAPEMCVTHGLTSVNPRKHLIGHHVDWARGFPFESFGLPDQYREPAPSVALFGFGYDDELLKKMDEPWAGVRAAERLLGDEARRRGTSVDALRRERRALYRLWIAEQARGEGAAPGAQRASGAQSAPQAWPAARGDTVFGASGG